MTHIIRPTSFALIMGLLAGCDLSTAAPSSPAAAAPTTAPVDGPVAKYSVPYHRPVADEVEKTLDHVRDRLEARMVMRIAPPISSEVIVNPRGATPLAVAGEKNFGSLDYPSGVAYAGLLVAGDATGDKKFSDFVSQRFQFVADTYGKFPNVAGGIRNRNPFRNLHKPDSLDACGAIGAAFIKARRAGLGGDLKPVIDRFAEYISRGQFRLEDGTLARIRPFPNSLWADDMYMSVPFLAQMGALTGETKYFDDAAKQVKQISARLFIPSSGLYTHAWNAQTDEDQPHYYWGRANGWCIMAMVELLEVMPENHPDRPAILKLLRAHAKGLASVQSGEGLWHQMLDRPDSYLETSCTGMFTFAIARAVNRGWLNAGTYGPVAIAGWNGLTTRISADGRVTGTCIGTGYAADYVYYYHRPATDDVHGYGPVLMAGGEIMKLLGDRKYRIMGSTSQPVMMQERRAGGFPGMENDASDSTTQPAAVDR